MYSSKVSFKFDLSIFYFFDKGTNNLWNYQIIIVTNENNDKQEITGFDSSQGRGAGHCPTLKISHFIRPESFCVVLLSRLFGELDLNPYFCSKHMMILKQYPWRHRHLLWNLHIYKKQEQHPV
jgi:hypothetical protein